MLSVVIDVGKNYKVLEEKHDFSGLTFSTPLNKIKIIEKNIPDVSVNAYDIQKYF